MKVVEKDAAGRTVRWGILERRGRPFHTNIQPLDAADAARHLKMLIEKMGSRAKEAVASVPAFLLLFAIADAPDSRWIPAAPGTFRAYGTPLGNGKYWLTGLPDEITEKYARICAAVGLDLVHLESESLALARVFGKSGEPVLIVDIGDRFTTFTVARGSQPVLVRRSDFGAASDARDVIPHIPRRSGDSEAAPRYVRDVIIKEAERIAAEQSLNKTIFTGGATLPLSISYGLQRPTLNFFRPNRTE
jgi:hypothetical protein